MKKLSILALAAILMLSLVGIAVAMSHEISGTVSSVDSAAKTVKVKTAKGEETVAIGADTKIMVGSSEKALGDVKTGDKVVIKNPGAPAKKKVVVGC